MATKCLSQFYNTGTEHVFCAQADLGEAVWKFMLLFIILDHFCIYTLSHVTLLILRLEAWYISPSHECCAGQVICFGQWNGCRHDISKCLKLIGQLS